MSTVDELILLRHAHAGKRIPVPSGDFERGLVGGGKDVALQLPELITSLHRPSAILSSPFRRCVETVEPLAEALGLDVEEDRRFSPDTRAGVRAAFAEAPAGAVVCTRGEVISRLLVGVRGRSPNAAVRPPRARPFAVTCWRCLSHRLCGESYLMSYSVGYFVGSLSSTSINRVLSRALIRLAPADLEFTEIPIGELPLYSQDFDDDFPPRARALKEALSTSDAILFVSPEYNRSIPGALKNAIDWASRPFGQNSFDNMPAAVIGASVGQIGTAMAQQSLRGVLSYCNARQMTAPEAYIAYSPDVFTARGEVLDASTREFLTSYMSEFRTYIARVLAVVPQSDELAGSRV